MPIFRFAFSPDGKRLASADGGGILKFWSLEPSHEVLTIPVDGNGGLALDPNGTRLAVSTGDGIKIFELRSGKLQLEINNLKNAITAIAFSPDGSEVATGGTDQMLRLWNTSNGYELHEIPVSDPKIRTIAYRPDGKALAVAGNAGIITIYTRDSQKVILTWMRVWVRFHPWPLAQTAPS